MGVAKLTVERKGSIAKMVFGALSLIEARRIAEFYVGFGGKGYQVTRWTLSFDPGAATVPGYKDATS